MSNLSNAIEQFHVFSKTPVSSSLGLGQAVNRGGHTVSLSDVLGDDLPFFSKDQFLSMADAKDALNGAARENDIIQVGNEIVKRVNGSWTPITLNDGDTLQNKDGADVLLYHKGVRLEAVTAGNNSGTSSQGNSKGGKECYFAGRIRKAGENGELVQFFIGVNDKILAGLPSLGYKPTLEVESETTTEIIQAEGTDYWINPYAGIVVFEAARPISSATVHKNDELCIKISCFEYIGKMADSTKQEKLKYVNETNTSLELGGNGVTISVKGPLSFNEGGAFISNKEMIQFGGNINPYLELQALNVGGYAGTIALNTDTIFINGPLHLAHDTNTIFNGDWLYKYGSDLYWGNSKITNQSGTVYTEGNGISLFNNQISIKRSGGDNSGLSFDSQGGIKVDFSYAEKYFSWIAIGPSSMNISSPSLTLGQFDSTSCIKISDNTISFNGPRIILGSDSTSVFIDGPISVSNGITIDSYEEHEYTNTLYNKLGDLYWNGTKLNEESATFNYISEESGELILGYGQGGSASYIAIQSRNCFDLIITDAPVLSAAPNELYLAHPELITFNTRKLDLSAQSLIISGPHNQISLEKDFTKIKDNNRIDIEGPNESQITLSDDGISIKTNEYGNGASIFIQGPGDSSIIIDNGVVKLEGNEIRFKENLLVIGPENQLTFNGTVAINGPIRNGLVLDNDIPSDTSSRLYNNNGDLYWNGSKVGGSSYEHIVEHPGWLYLGWKGDTGTEIDNIQTWGKEVDTSFNSLTYYGPSVSFENIQNFDINGPGYSNFIIGPDGIKIASNETIIINGPHDTQITLADNGIHLGYELNPCTTTIEGPSIFKNTLELSSLSSPSDVDSKLYNKDGDLYWNGNKLNNQGGSDYLFYSPLFKGPSNEITLELADDSNLNVDETGRLKVNSSAFASIENFTSLENRVSTLESDLIGVAVKFNSQNNDSNNVLQGALFNIQENGSIISINSEADLSDTLLQSNAVIEVHVKSEQTPFNITWNEAWKWSGTPLETTEENTYYIIQVRHDAWNNIVCKVTHQYN